MITLNTNIDFFKSTQYQVSLGPCVSEKQKGEDRHTQIDRQDMAGLSVWVNSEIPINVKRESSC